MTTLVIQTNPSQTTDVLIRDMGILIPSDHTTPGVTDVETFTDQANVARAEASKDLNKLLNNNAHGAGSSTLTLTINGVSISTPRDILGQAHSKSKVMLHRNNYTTQNSGFEGVVGETVGRVDVFLATALNDTVAAGLFTAGAPNPTVVTVGSGTFAQNDIVQVKGSVENDGVYEVESHVGTLLTFRGITVEDFSRDQVVAGTDSATIRKVNVSIWRSSAAGTPEHGKGSTTPITYELLAHAADVPTVVSETFAATNARFFGELGLPAVQGWIDTPTGSATIDLVTENVLGTVKQVVRHNDDVADGSTTSRIDLTAQNWTDINAFGASYSGTSRLDTTNGADGFFSGLQANAAENPLASGNRRYGIQFNNNGPFLRVTEPGGTTVTFDGGGGNPAIGFDEWISWECVVPAGLGAAQFYVNGILTTFAPTFLTNTGGLGTRVLVGSGSSSGIDRVTFHDNFGVTVYEESATKTLAAATMTADTAQVFIPEGKRDYTIILPDGNPRPIGTKLEILASNLFGNITLTNQVPATPEILYNGLRTLVIPVNVKEFIRGLNTVNNGNVYVGLGFEDVDRAQPIFTKLHSSVDQIPSTTNPTVITYNNQDAINGIGHSPTLNPGELTILPGLSGTYFVMAQSQVGKTMGATKRVFNMFLQVDRGGGFADEPNSTIKLVIKDSDLTDVIVKGFNIELQVGDKIRMMQKVDDAGDGLGLLNTDPVVGPPTVPRTPSIIFTMMRIAGTT